MEDLKSFKEMGKETNYKNWRAGKCSLKELFIGTDEMKSRGNETQNYWMVRNGIFPTVAGTITIGMWLVLIMLTTPLWGNPWFNPWTITGFAIIIFFLVSNVIALRIEIYEAKVLGIGANVEIRMVREYREGKIETPEKLKGLFPSKKEDRNSHEIGCKCISCSPSKRDTEVEDEIGIADLGSTL